MSLSNRGLSSAADGSALNCRANTTWVGAIVPKGRTRQSVRLRPVRLRNHVQLFHSSLKCGFHKGKMIIQIDSEVLQLFAKL